MKHILFVLFVFLIHEPLFADIVRLRFESNAPNACQEPGYKTAWLALRHINIDFNLPSIASTSIPGCNFGRAPFVAEMIVLGDRADIEKLKLSGRLHFIGEVISGDFILTETRKIERHYHFGIESVNSFIFDIFRIDLPMTGLSDAGLFDRLCDQGRESMLLEMSNSPKNLEVLDFIKANGQAHMIAMQDDFHFEDGTIFQSQLGPFACTWRGGSLHR